MVRWYKAKCFCIAIFVCMWDSASATQHGSIDLLILEELEPNTFVADLALEAGLASKWEPSVVDMLQYEYLQPSNRYQSFFTVNHDSGILQVAKRIDRESICAHKATCVLKLSIVVQPFQYFEVIQVNINVLDINDNSPNFPAPEVSKSISEASGPGTGFSIPAADDPDSPRNSVQRYDLTSGPGKFDLKVSTSLAGETELQLVLKERLDREVQDTYQVRVTATDGGVPARIGSLVVNITVQDINDNIPMFMNSTYRVSVRENLPIGSVLLKVSATDPDAGSNGTVLYELSHRTYASLGRLFGMNNVSGEIYLKAELDYEKASVYHLTVVAKDQSPETLSIDAAVIITVTDLNDHAPKIFTSTGMATVSEWTKVGKFVAHIAVEDQDSVTNGQFSCSVSDSHFKLTRIIGNEFQLDTAGTFDREMQARYNVTVTCIDWGSPQLTSTVSIVVLVLDENDNYPRFVNSPYVGSLSENNDIGASILQTTANDRDLDDNGLVLFKLAGVKEEMVEITKNGLIRATAVFDYEQIPNIDFVVIAYDQGIPSRSVSTSVTINIVNVNDEPPVFAKATYYFSIMENEPLNTELGQVSASDSDAPPFNELRYTIREIGMKEISSFYIDYETGTIKTKRVLDRERQDVYYLEAVAIDKGDTPMSRSVSVTVRVNDKNDNSPIIDFPNPANKSVTVSAGIPEGYEVTQIKAHDNDFADNKKLSFYIIDQTKQDIFTIDPWTGVITLNEKLNFQGTRRKIKLDIQVKDNGWPQQHSVETSLDIVFDKSIPPPTGDFGGEEDTFILIISSVVSLTVLLVVLLAIAVLCVYKTINRISQLLTT